LGWFALGLVIGLLAGAALGVAGVIYWKKNPAGRADFQESLQKEIFSEGVEGRVHNLKNRVEKLEGRLRALEETRANMDTNTVAEEPRREEKEAELLRGGPGNEAVEEAVEAVKEKTVRNPVHKESPAKVEGDRNTRVLNLWQDGRGMEEIARETGLGKGEVELILSLRKKE